MKSLNEKIAEASAMIKGLDFDHLELGKHEVDDDFYYVVQAYETKDPATARYEAHEKYVDIQYLISGIEAIDIAPVETLEIDEVYDAAKDACFLKNPERATKVVLTAGSYVVLYPEDAHKPGLTVDEVMSVRKIVGKVRI